VAVVKETVNVGDSENGRMHSTAICISTSSPPNDDDCENDDDDDNHDDEAEKIMISGSIEEVFKECCLGCIGGQQGGDGDRG
jgi:hypothetical protein